MTDKVLNKQEILQEAQRNVRKFGNTVYTHDAEFDVLRVNFGGYFHQFPVNEYKNGFLFPLIVADECDMWKYWTSWENTRMIVFKRSFLL